jgi:hypothetical protein
MQMGTAKIEIEEMLKLIDVVCGTDRQEPDDRHGQGYWNAGQELKERLTLGPEEYKLNCVRQAAVNRALVEAYNMVDRIGGSKQMECKIDPPNPPEEIAYYRGRFEVIAEIKEQLKKLAELAWTTELRIRRGAMGPSDDPQ